MKWKSRAIFVSSTFADMQAERDHLYTKVFPALQERLRESRCRLEWVDLRLGVAAAGLSSDAEREQRVLQTCLAEVKRCSPFVVGLLGDRYGWVPPTDRIERAALDSGYIGDASGRSVTELEMQLGALGSQVRWPRGFFYLRRPLPYDAMPIELAVRYSDAFRRDPDSQDSMARLAALKLQIEARLPDRARHYDAQWDAATGSVSGLDDWGRQVFEDLVTEIEKDFVDERFYRQARRMLAELDKTEASHQRQALIADDFLDLMAQSFFGREDLLNELERFVTPTPDRRSSWARVITSAPGLGKSALCAALVTRLQAGKGIVLWHSADSAIDARSADDMLRRWVSDIRTALRIDDAAEVPTAPEHLETVFRKLLLKLMSEPRVTLVIDALDKLEPTGRRKLLARLPEIVPDNVRLVATATSVDVLGKFADEPGVEVLKLPDLEPDAARQVITEICNRYHRSIDAPVVEALLGKRGDAGVSSSNFAWLCLAVDQLNLAVGGDFSRAVESHQGAPADRLQALLLEVIERLPPDLPGLYEYALRRAETFFGTQSVRTLLGLLAISRSGLSEEDIAAVHPRFAGEKFNPERFASLRRHLSSQIRRLNVHERWELANDQIRSAVFAHLASCGVSIIRFHEHTAAHLAKLYGRDARPDDEVLYHLLKAEQWEQAAKRFRAGKAAPLVAMEALLLEELLASETQGTEVQTAWAGRLMATLGQPSNEKEANRDAALLGSILRLIDALGNRGGIEVRMKLLREVETRLEAMLRHYPSNGRLKRLLTDGRRRAGNLLKERGDPAAASESYAKALEFNRRRRPSSTERRQVEAERSCLYHELARSMLDAGQASHVMAHLGVALQLKEKLIKEDAQSIADRSDLASIRITMGDAAQRLGKLQEALEHYEKARAVVEELAREKPDSIERLRDLNMTSSRIGNVLRLQGVTLLQTPRYKIWRIGDRIAGIKLMVKALLAFEDGFDIAKRLCTHAPDDEDLKRDLAVSHTNIGSIHQHCRRHQESLTSQMAALEILKELATRDPGNVQRGRDLADVYWRLAHAFKQMRNSTQADRMFAEGRAVLARLKERQAGGQALEHVLAQFEAELATG